MSLHGFRLFLVAGRERQRCKKRKRRRKKKKGGADTLGTSFQSETAVPVDAKLSEEDLVQESAGGEEHGSSADELAGKPKKRRRRRGRKGPKGADEGVMAEAAPSGTPAAEPAAAAPAATDEPQLEPAKEAGSVPLKPKRIRAPRAKKPAETPPATVEAEVVEPAAEVVAAPKKPRRAAAKKEPKPVPETVEPPIAPPKPASRPRRPKKVVEKQ